MHSCPERVSLLLESVSGVDKVSIHFTSQTATVRAHGELCISEESRRRLTNVLERNRYGGEVTTIHNQSFKSR